MLDRVEVFLLVIDWTTSFSSVRHLTGLGMCVRQRNVIGISLSVVLSTVRWKVFYVWFYIDVHTSCIFIFFFQVTLNFTGFYHRKECAKPPSMVFSIV